MGPDDGDVAGGDPACWIARVCVDCGRVPDGADASPLDDHGRCATCRVERPRH